MRKKLANVIVSMAKKAAYKNFGKSFYLGTYEIKPPKELLNKKRHTGK